MTSEARTPPESSRSAWFRSALVGVLCAAIALIVAPTASKVVSAWSGPGDETAHGPWAAAIGLGLLLHRRSVISAAPRRSRPRLGLTVMAACLWLLLAARADGFLGLEALCAFGVVASALLAEVGIPRLAIFPLALIGLAGPIPLRGAMVVLLKGVATTLAVGTLDVLAIPVVRVGHVLHFADTRVEVDAACSGLTGLTTFCIVACSYAYLRGWNVRTSVLVGAAIPLAIVMNAIRVLLLCWLAANGLSDDPLWHEGAGLITYAAGFAILFALASMIVPVNQPPDQGSPLTTVVDQGQTNSRMYCARPASVLIALLGVWASCMISDRPVGPPVTGRIPRRIGSWTGVTLTVPAAVPVALGTTDIAALRFEREAEAGYVDLYVIRSTDDPWRAYHPPDVCFLGEGYALEREEALSLRSGSGEEFSTNLRVFVRGRERVLVCYWYRVASWDLSGGRAFRFASIAHRVTGASADSCLVRLSTFHDSPERAEARIRAFAGEALQEVMAAL